MIAPEPFFEPRGTPISVFQRVHALSKLGHKVDLLTYHVGTPVSLPGVTLHRTPPVPFIRHVRIGPSWAKAFLDMLLFLKAFGMLLRGNYDVIHSHEEASFFAAFAAPVFGALHVYDMHSSLPQQLRNFRVRAAWPLVKLFEVLEWFVLRTCDAVITIGDDLEAYVRGHHPDAQVITIQNLPVRPSGEGDLGLADLKASLGLEGRLPIVYTGTFERYQGLELLLDSAEIVARQDASVLFVLVGGRPDQIEVWRARVKRRGLSDHVTFVGTVQPEVAMAYMSLAEILVSPRVDGTSVPLKIYSYLHAGKSIVATSLKAHTQVLDDSVAVLVPADKEALADGILRLVRDAALRERLGIRAREFARKAFDSADYLAKVACIYNELPMAATAAGQQAGTVEH